MRTRDDIREDICVTEKGPYERGKRGDNIGRLTYDRGKVSHEQMDRDIR
jgi:hypothetical protein